jgi:O-antigen/teichoic acid export membrane protein
MTVILPFLINAGLNFALGLLVAAYLGPETFGRYAIGSAIMVLVNALVLDWLRMSVMRFYTKDARTVRPHVRATLDMLQAVLCALLAMIVLVVLAADLSFGLGTTLIAIALAAAICSGLFDFHTAIARARFMDGLYARLIFTKNTLAFLLMVGAAWWTNDPAFVLAGLCISVIISLAFVRRQLSDGLLGAVKPDWALAGQFALYAFPLVWANIVYSGIPFLNRAALAAQYGYAEAGYFSLASDMGIRLFGTAGTALEIILLRGLVELEQSAGQAAAEEKVSRNLVIVAMVLVPLATGWWLTLPAFEALLVPANYHGSFQRYLSVLIPAIGALGIIVAGLNPVFQIRRRTASATMAAFTGLGACAIGLLVLPPMMGPIGYAWAQTAGFVTIMLIMIMLAGRAIRWRDIGFELAVIILTTLLMVGCIWPLRGTMSPAIELCVMGLAGGLIFTTIMLIANVAGCGVAFKARFSR